MQEKIHDFPNALEACFLVLALFMAEHLAVGLLWDWQTSLEITPIAISVLGSVLGNGMVFTAVMQLKHLSYRKLFHSTATPPGKVFGYLLIPILLLMPGLVLLMSAIGDVLVTLFPMSRYEETLFEYMADSSLPMLMAACILAPFLEEMLFRGVILRSFLQQYGRWPAIIGSAILFGLAHMNLYQFVIASILGLLLGWLYERTQSLLPCITLHATYNTILTFNETAITDVREENALFWWVLAALLAASGMHYLHKMLDQLKAEKAP